MFCLVRVIQFVNLKIMGVVNHHNHMLFIKVDIQINTVLTIDSAQFSPKKTLNTA